MGRHRPEGILQPVMSSGKVGWRRYFRTLDFSKPRHNQSRPWAAPIVAGILAVLASVPAGLSF